MAASTASLHFVKAVQLGQLILRETERMQRTPLDQMGLLSLIPMMKLAKGIEGASTDAVCPRIHEVIMYGSVARGKPNPGDIDIMLIENGHFSPIFVDAVKRSRRGTLEMSPNSDEQLQLLMDWITRGSNEWRDILDDTSVDLHVFPLEILTSKAFRDEMTSHMTDPEFFRNIFQDAKRLNFELAEPKFRSEDDLDWDAGDEFAYPALEFVGDKFVPFPLNYLEKKYDCDLSDLRVA